MPRLASPASARGLALPLPLVALAMQWLLWPLIGSSSTARCFPVRRSAARRPGCAPVLSELLVWWIFIPPVYTVSKGTPAPPFR